MGQIEDLQHQCDENSRVIAKLTERIRLLELKGASDQAPIPYPFGPYNPQPHPRPSYEYWGPSWTVNGTSDLTHTNKLGTPSPEAEPLDTDLPGSPAWQENPQDEGEDG